MDVYVLFMRGINVGGRNILPMSELKTTLQGLGCRDVKTYIQSGNAVFAHDSAGITGLGKKLSSAIKSEKGFSPDCLILSLAELEKAAENNPFPEAEDDPKSLHLAFLDARPESPDFDLMQRLATDSERFELKGKVSYLHAPDGIGRSKLAAASEKALGVSATSRNWRTVQKVLAMGQALKEGLAS